MFHKDAVAVPTSGQNTPSPVATGPVASGPNPAGNAGNTTSVNGAGATTAGPGGAVPSPSSAGQAAAQSIVQAVQVIPDTVALSADQRKATVKVKIAAVTAIADMAAIASGDSRFSVISADPQKMAADVAQVADMQAVSEALKIASSVISDTTLSALADGWKQALAIYGLAQTLAKDDPVLQVRLGTMTAFMSQKPRKKAKSTAPVAAPVVASAPVETPQVTVTATSSQPVKRSSRADDHHARRD